MDCQPSPPKTQCNQASAHPLRFWLTREDTDEFEYTDPLRRGASGLHQCPPKVGSKPPLPLYADFRLHPPMTHVNDAGEHYTFQLAVYAHKAAAVVEAVTFTDLTTSSSSSSSSSTSFSAPLPQAIQSTALHCMNFNGSDYWGR